MSAESECRGRHPSYGRGSTPTPAGQLGYAVKTDRGHHYKTMAYWYAVGFVDSLQCNSLPVPDSMSPALFAAYAAQHADQYELEQVAHLSSITDMWLAFIEYDA